MNETNELKTLKQEEQMEAGRTAVNGGLFAGIAMVIVGLIYLVANLTGGWDLLGGKLWLVWLLIPVGGVLAGAYAYYTSNGRRVNGRLVTMLLWALLPFGMLAAATLNIVSWSAMWPLTLVLVGITILVNRGQ